MDSDLPTRGPAGPTQPPVPTDPLRQYQLMVESIREYAVFLLDSDGRVIRWNIGAERVLGWREDEMLGRSTEIVFTPEDRAAGAPSVEMATARRDGYAADERWHLRKDGSRFFAWGRLMAALDEAGAPVGFVKVLRDATPERLAREALHASQARLDNILAIRTVGVLSWGAGFRLVDMNDAFLRMTGFTREEALGRTWQELTPPEFHAASRRAVEEVMTVGETTPYEKQYFRKDGSRWWGLFAARRLGDEVVEFVLDVTERRVAQEALRHSEARWRGLFESLHEGVGLGEVIYGADGQAVDIRFTEVNAAFERQSGLPAAQVLGRPLTEALPGLERGWIDCYVRVAETGEPAHFEHYAAPLGRWFEVRAYCPAPARFATLFLDVTERRKADEALRDADRRKDEFLAMLAHELRNPLTPLTNALRILERTEPLTERGRSMLAVADRQRGQLARLVDDLLEVTRITRGMIALQPAPMSLGTAVHAAVEARLPGIEERGQSITVSLPEQPVRIVADPARVAQVLDNLLANAAKFTPPGGAIRVELEDRPDEVEIRVIDNGIGIAPEGMSKLFELFSQVDATFDRAQGGLGIGLALVKRLAELHGGGVSAASEGLGRGATFAVRLPRRPPS